MGGKMKTDDPVCRRIVRAFLDFLSSVEPTPGVDVEGLEVARECLTEAFKVDLSSSDDDQIRPDLLVEMFKSLHSSEHRHNDSYFQSGRTSDNVSQTSSGSDILKSSTSQDGLQERETHFLTESSKDELFGQFFSALEKVHFFNHAPDGNDDTVQLEKVTCLFHNAINEMEGSGCQQYNKTSLAETLKSRGNKAMQSKLYADAIELYTCAIALCENHAVYYSNRAAAYTQIGKFDDAIKDCHKSLEIDPNYSKAYSRLGTAYYALGKYADSIDKGFKKALQLDPNNEFVKENIRVAEQKLEELQHRERNQWDTTSSNHPRGESDSQSTSGSTSHATPPPFTSFPFDPSTIPANFANIFMNMAGNESSSQSSSGSESRAVPPPFGSFPLDPNAIPANLSSMFTNWGSTAYQGQEQHSQGEGSGDPEIRIGGNINLNVGENMPENLSGALRSVMEMFTGTASRENAPDGADGRSAPS
ncbi:small glutamine-rich tetratricopeptide repeat-containing protein [Rhodamnia argentea]|uniref:Small glutamine-rich tetratricopeptide repeat-containing protein n=1 Tax=Rhodamnia argentea TaxID=178133 RepID=A0A8B8NZP6_9MYRT|nr:small glutamine-rich tetratricopeptide repeat-containing protein [Rhodamnia argentea]